MGFRLGFPVWFHHHGCKLVVKVRNKSKVFLESTAAWVDITPNSEVEDRWIIKWHVQHSKYSYVSGQLNVSSDVLLSMFCFQQNDNVVKQKASTYIKQGECLTFPNPGTGYGGDSNISVFVSEDIAGAVLSLFKNYSWQKRLL